MTKRKAFQSQGSSSGGGGEAAAEYYHSLRGHADKLHWDADNEGGIETYAAVDDDPGTGNNNNGSDSAIAIADAVHHEKEASVLPVNVDATTDTTSGIDHHIIKTDGASATDDAGNSSGSTGQAPAGTNNVTTTFDQPTNDTTATATDTSFLHDKITLSIPRNQSPHLTLPNYDEHQKIIAANTEEFDNDDEIIDETQDLSCTKHSIEKDAQILPENTPIRWDPPSDWNTNNGINNNNNGGENDGILVGGGGGGGGGSDSTTSNTGFPPSSSSSSTSSPRGPEEGTEGIESTYGEKSSTGICTSTNGVFGSPRFGGVVLRYQYELTIDRRLGNEWQYGILPNLEGGISDSLLPVLFEEECIPTSVDKGRRRDKRMLVLLDGDHAISRGNLRGGEHGGARRRLSNSSSSSNSRGWSRSRRRLEEVITGLDSEPMDFPDRGRECRYPPLYEDATCYVMEGALTVHFPPKDSVFNYVQGVQFSTLNAIRDDMAYGHYNSAHASILELKLLDSSYSLEPFVTPELQDAINNRQQNRERIPEDVDDLHDMVDDMFLPFVKSKMKSMDHHGKDSRERDSVRSPVDYHYRHHRHSNSQYSGSSRRRNRQGTVNSSRRSGSHSASADAFLAENGGYRNASDDEGLDTSARRRAKSRKEKERKEKRRRKSKKKKKRKKKSKHSSRDVNFDSTDTDNTDTDDNTAGRGTSSSSTDDNNSTTSSGSRSSRSSTTSSDRRSTTDGTSTSDDDKETTSTSTSDDDKETTTSTSTSDDDKSSSSGGSEKDDDFDINSMASSHSNFMLQRRNLRRRSKSRNLGPTTRSKPKSNLVMSGGAGEDDNSVMTGMTGATGTHSMASAATAQAKNNMTAAAQRAPMNVGSGVDRVSNTTTTTTDGASLLGEVTDDEEVELSDMTNNIESTTKSYYL
ncbi:LOW QUALITY PROTEIN: hypothetical protein ACHAWU_009470 [Discostella pseudostelligera]|uniref:Uncharacterized protein n=1 Tax=Discostella pseudostelligera TaxID=259834 RepID=A0ABD3MA58_9STRA